MKTHTPSVKGSIASRGFTPEETNGHTLPARGRVIVMPSEEDRAAAQAARPALARLCEAMALRTGQSGTLRTLLYSLWNGQPASLLDVVTLDWTLRKDLCAVLLAFGFEPRTDAAAHFFFDALKNEITQHGLWTWFAEAGEQSEGVAA